MFNIFIYILSRAWLSSLFVSLFLMCYLFLFGGWDKKKNYDKYSILSCITF